MIDTSDLISDSPNDSSANSMSNTPFLSAAPFSRPTPNDLPTPRPKEIGGPKGLEPTRYGDWEKAGRCIDF